MVGRTLAVDESQPVGMYGFHRVGRERTLFFGGATVCVLVLWALFGRRGGAHHWGPPWHGIDHWAHGSGDPTRSALQILNERYASGEIQKPEYEERKATILAGRDH